jgi:hypothetical protein
VRTILFAAVTALTLGGGAAMAQTATDTTTTQTNMSQPDPAAPPAGTLSTTHVQKAQDAYGNSVDSKSTSYRDSTGVAQDSSTTTKTMAAPPPPPVSSTTSTTTETTDAPR